MNCPKCNSVINDGNSFCTQCGYQFNNNVYNGNNTTNINNNTQSQNINGNQVSNIGIQYYSSNANQNAYNTQNVQFHSKLNMNPNGLMTDEQSNQKNMTDDDLIRAYIGKNSYKIINNSFSVSTFFFSIIYLYYRKLWLLGFILSCVMVLLKFVLSTKIIGIVSFTITIVLSFAFRSIYIKHVNRKIQKIKKKNLDKNQIELEEICRKKGGTSIIVPIILILIPIAITAIIVTKNVTTTMNTAKTKSLKFTSDSVESWFKNEYNTYLFSTENEYISTDEDFIKICVTNNCISENGMIASYFSGDILNKVYKPNIEPSDILTSGNGSFTITDSISNNYKVSYVAINSTTGKVCVKLSANFGSVCSSSCTSEQCVSKTK